MCMSRIFYVLCIEGAQLQLLLLHLLLLWSSLGVRPRFDILHFTTAKRFSSIFELGNVRECQAFEYVKFFGLMNTRRQWTFVSQVTSMHSWQEHIQEEHWRRRRRRRLTRRRPPWCRPQGANSSGSSPWWWTWPAGWSPPRPPWLAPPCSPTRRRTRTPARSWSKGCRWSRCRTTTLSQTPGPLWDNYTPLAMKRPWNIMIPNLLRILQLQGYRLIGNLRNLLRLPHHNTCCCCSPFWNHREDSSCLKRRKNSSEKNILRQE